MHPDNNVLRARSEPPAACVPPKRGKGGRRPKRVEPPTDECVVVMKIRHDFVREVRTHPEDPEMRQDRMVCTGCDHVLYDWAGRF